MGEVSESETVGTLRSGCCGFVDSWLGEDWAQISLSPSKDFLRHRATLRFVVMDAPLNDLLSPDDRKLAVVELCCKAGSMIQKACETSQLRCCGVTKDETF